MHQYTLDSGDSATLVASTKVTLLQLVTPATRRAKLLEAWVSMTGVTPADTSVLVQLIRQTTTGTMSAATPILIDPADPASLCTGCQKIATVEPTSGDVLRSWYIDPTKSTFPYRLPMSDIDGAMIAMAVSTKLGLCLTPLTQVTAAKARATMDWQE